MTARGDGPEMTELRSIGEASLHLAEVVRDIALYSDVEAGPQQVGHVDVGAILKLAAAETRPLIADRTELVIQDGGGSRIRSDGRLLASALVALGRHIAQLPLGPRVEWSAACTGPPGSEQLVIEVANGGPADAAPDPRPARVPTSGTARVGGYGLSLALARRICERLGGELTAEPQAGGRMRFRLAVPSLA